MNPDPFRSDITAIPAQRPRRRWLQFGVRAILIFTTVVAVAVAWWSHKARQQRAAVVALRKADVLVSYDFQQHGRQRPSYCPIWLVNALGVDYFASFELVGFSYTHTNADLKHVRRLTGVRDLSITSQITDDGLLHLEGLTSLQRLSIVDNQVTDAGLAHLRNFTALERLDLRFTTISGDGLKHFKDFNRLRVLELDGTNVTDAGLDHLKNLTALRRLGLGGTKVTDGGVARLQEVLPYCEISR